MPGDINSAEFTDMKTNIALILDRTKCLPEMNKRISDIDKKQDVLCEKVNTNRDDIKDLKKKSDNWDLANTFVSLGAAVGAVLSGIFGSGK